jgi:hypothetical protein
VQRVNVLPKHLEFVFAPDPSFPNHSDELLDFFLRQLQTQLDMDICGEHDKAPVINGAVAHVDEGEEPLNFSQPPPIDCDPPLPPPDPVEIGKLSPGDFLFMNQRIWSPQGGYFMFMQGDGNLVIRNVDGGLIWNTGTVEGPAFVNLQGDGNFVLRDMDDDDDLWQTGTSGNYNVVLLGNNAQLSVYAGTEQKYWSGSFAEPTVFASGPRTELTRIHFHKTFNPVGAIIETSLNESRTCGTLCAAGPLKDSCNAWVWTPDGICRLLDSSAALVDSPGANAAEKWRCIGSTCALAQDLPEW